MLNVNTFYDRLVSRDEPPTTSVRYTGFDELQGSPGPDSSAATQRDGRVDFGSTSNNNNTSTGGRQQLDSGSDSDEPDLAGCQHQQQAAESDSDESGLFALATGSGGVCLTDEHNLLLLHSETFTVDQAVDALGFGKFQIKLSLLTGIAWMADAMEMMILAILSPALHCEWWLSDVKLALINTIVFTGMMFSSTWWGHICDKYGRRSGLIMTAAFTFYFGLLSAAAPSFGWILVLRGLTGFGIGGVPQSITLYSEFLPSAYRARCVVLIEVFWAVGTALEVGLAYLVMEQYGWRLLLAISALPCLIFCIACFWLPESARYQVACGQMDEAHATLCRIAIENGKPMLQGKLVDSKDGDANPVQRGRIADLLAGDMKTTTLLLWFIWLANSFCYYGLVLFTTKLFESGDECHGGAAPSSEHDRSLRESCALECHQLTKDDYVDLMLTTLAEFPGLLLTAIVIERLGRRLTMGVEFGIFTLFTFLLFACLNRSSLTAFIFIARASISGAFQAAYVYTPEVYPTTTRAIGLGCCSGMARLGAIVTPFVAQVAASWSLNVPTGVYGVVSLFGLLAALVLPIETKGRQMKDTH